jgi:branched-chain amino acid transport system ATP-binding protein
MFPILKDRALQQGGTLSGGEQQMLAIGRALMSRPKMLMMDEPSMGIAPILVAKIFDTVKNVLNAQGMTILLVEQNANAALRMSNRAYVLETGNVVLTGSGQDLLRDPRVREAYLG